MRRTPGEQSLPDRAIFPSAIVTFPDKQSLLDLHDDMYDSISIFS